jgi:lipoprotein-anchoring transpeptidase ErfK/SrfK
VSRPPLALLAVAVAAVAGCGGGGAAAPGRLSALPARPLSGVTRFAPGALVSTAGRSVIATARRRAVVRRLHGRVFLVKRRRGAWLQVYLPTRPNRSTGWVRARDVRLSATPYRLQVQLRRHRLVLRRAGHVVLRAPIGVGRAVSPTPVGRYYVTDLLRPHDPHGFFGPYALGLSAHSDVYTRFAGGDGQVGIHGTSEPAGLGRDVSHGCIRVRNAVISRLAHRVPLGTPVDVTRG